MNVKWLGHASFLIDSSLKIYVDPWKISLDEKADIILITHSHHDHFSIEDIKKLIYENTVLISIKEVCDHVKDFVNVREIEANEEIIVKGIRVLGVPAYNLEAQFHPKSNGWIGYVVVVDEESYYFAGDTDYIPEMIELKKEHIDYAFLPVGGTYTMDVSQAVKAAHDINAKTYIPMHFGDIIGSFVDAEEFKEKLEKEYDITILDEVR